MGTVSKYNPLRERRLSYKARRTGFREPRQRFLIVCEGARTEPNYFERFRVPKDVRQIDVRGLGYNTVTLVEAAIQLREDGDYDQVWCVFDKDDFSADIFNRAIDLALRNEIKVAYSNEAFELWYVLHYDFLNAGVTRDQYITILEQRMKRKYEKNSRSMYDLLAPMQETALRNARNLQANYDPSRPAQDNPSTTVHLLVEELNRFIS
jgi:hypothetical protein